MRDLTIAVGGAGCGLTPPMPFVAKRFEGSAATLPAKFMLEGALLRCGFDVLDVHSPVKAPQDAVMQANRQGADGIVLLSCATFGSGKSFNDVCGSTVKYTDGRTGAGSRELAEDVCAKIGCMKQCRTAETAHAFGGSFCPAVTLDIGYLTNFDEAKLMCDPDYLHNTVEHAAMGICEYYGMPYIPHIPAAYKGGLPKTGARGKAVKMLQAALCANGYILYIDGIYGKNTELALRTFFINNGLEGTDDISELHFVTPTALKAGSKHTAVLYLQRKLTSKLYRSPLSGVLCEDTMAAINEFLTETGNDICDGEVTKAAFLLLSAVGGGRPRLF